MNNINSIESSSQGADITYFEKFNAWLLDSSKATFTAKKIAVCASIIFSFGIAYLVIASACAARHIASMSPNKPKANTSYFCNTISINRSTQAKVYFGAFPKEKHENWLQEQNCKLIISASTEEKRNTYALAGKYVAEENKKNPSILSLENKVDFLDLRQTKERIDYHLAKGESIYIHIDKHNEAASSLAVFIAAKEHSISVEKAIQKLGNCTLSQTSKAIVEKALKPDDPFFGDRFTLFDIEE